MITISTDKGLVKVDAWEDILSRAGFTTELDPAKHELNTIIGRYIFGDKVRCGLSNWARSALPLRFDSSSIPPIPATSNLGFAPNNRTIFGHAINYSEVSQKNSRRSIQK
jgi:hypothetical protein